MATSAIGLGVAGVALSLPLFRYVGFDSLAGETAFLASTAMSGASAITALMGVYKLSSIAINKLSQALDPIADRIDNSVKNFKERLNGFWSAGDIIENRKNMTREEKAYNSLFYQRELFDAENYSALRGFRDKIADEASKNKDDRYDNKNIEAALKELESLKTKAKDNLEAQNEYDFQKVLQATGLLGPNLKEINPKDRSQAEKAFDSYLENISKIVTEGNVYATQNLFSLKSIINRNNSDLCNLVNLIVDGFNPILHQEKDKIAGSLGDLFDSSLRAEIKKERVKMGLPKIEAFEDLIFYDNRLLERVESQSKSFQELAENDEEYKATFNKAKDVFERQTLAEKNGFADVNKYEYYKKREFFINAGEIINRLQQNYKTENIKAKTEVLNVNSNFIKEINSGEHNDFLKKIMDVIKENNPNAQELKKVETIIANISKKIETENVSQPTKTKKTITSPAASDNLGR